MSNSYFLCLKVCEMRKWLFFFVSVIVTLFGYTCYFWFIATFYPEAHKGCHVNVFTHGIKMDGRVFCQGGSRKKFVWAVSQKL